MSGENVWSNSDFAFIDLVTLYERKSKPIESANCRYKIWLDRIIAGVLLVPGLPLMAILCLIVRMTSRGKPIYRQVRVGRHGSTFTMYKIRSMRQDAEKRSGAVWTQVNDPRITMIGWILRKFHLDELPQLFNVLKGEMSLVGPRPERPEFVFVLMDEIPGYLDRLAVLPGVTGLSQINLPPDTDLNSVRRKQYLDLVYIKTANLWLDLRMMFCTCLRLIGLRGALATRFTGVERKVPAELYSHAETGSSAQVRALGAQTSTPESCHNGLDQNQSICVEEPQLISSISRITGPESVAGRSLVWDSRVLEPENQR